MRNPFRAYGMTAAWWRITLKLWALGALLAAVLALPTGCVDTLADAVLGDDGPTTKPDTVVVHDTVYAPCHHHWCRR